MLKLKRTSNSQMARLLGAEGTLTVQGTRFQFFLPSGQFMNSNNVISTLGVSQKEEDVIIATSHHIYVFGH